MIPLQVLEAVRIKSCLTHLFPFFLSIPTSVMSADSAVKILLAMQKGRRLRFDPWVGKIPWRRKWQPTPVFLLGKFHGQRSLAGYSPWGCKESDTTEQLHSLHSLFFRPIKLETHLQLQHIIIKKTSLVAQRVKHLPAMQETRVQSLGREDLQEKEMAIHSSILAWKIPRTE